MSNVLAALFGGLGAGASSYGTQRIREQDQERLAAQRMAELQQQEQMRRTQMQEAQQLRQQDREQVNADMTAALKAMGMEVPQGVTLTPQTTPYITQQQVAKREQDRTQRERQGTYNALKQRGVPVGDQFDPNTDYGTVFKDYGREDGQANARAMQSTALAARAAADAARAAAVAGRGSPIKDQFLMRLGSEYEKTAEKRRGLYGTIETAIAAAPEALKGNGAAQASLLYGFITSLDPESTVREGEVDLMRKASPIVQNAKAQYNALINGKAALVTPQLAQQMEALMRERATRQAARDANIRNDYLGKAQRLGIDESDAFFPDFIPEPFRAKSGPDVNQLRAELRKKGFNDAQIDAALRAKGVIK